MSAAAPSVCVTCAMRRRVIMPRQRPSWLNHSYCPGVRGVQQRLHVAAGNGVRFEWHLLNTCRVPIGANKLPRHMSWLHEKFVRFRSSLHGAGFDAARSLCHASLCNQDE